MNKIIILYILCYYFVKNISVNGETNVKQYDCSDEYSLGSYSTIWKCCLLSRVNATNKIQIITNKTDSYNCFEFSNSYLQVLTSAACDTLPNLNMYIATKARIISIDEDAFQNCKKLRYINLKHNYLTIISENLFKFNPELEAIYLSTNNITNVPENLFKHNPNLKDVFLNDNKLTSLPKKIFENNKKIRELNLTENQLKNIQFIEEMPVQVNLTHLFLNDNHLIDLNIFLILTKFSKLEKLTLHRNKFLCKDERKIVETLKEKRIEIGEEYVEKCIEKVTEWMNIKFPYDNHISTFQHVLAKHHQIIILVLVTFGSALFLAIICLVFYITKLKRNLNERIHAEQIRQAEIYYDAHQFEMQSTDQKDQTVETLNGNGRPEETEDTYDHLKFEI